MTATPDVIPSQYAQLPINNQSALQTSFEVFAGTALAVQGPIVIENAGSLTVDSTAALTVS